MCLPAASTCFRSPLLQVCSPFTGIRLLSSEDVSMANIAHPDSPETSGGQRPSWRVSRYCASGEPEGCGCGTCGIWGCPHYYITILPYYYTTTILVYYYIRVWDCLEKGYLSITKHSDLLLKPARPSQKKSSKTRMRTQKNYYSDRSFSSLDASCI